MATEPPESASGAEHLPMSPSHFDDGRRSYRTVTTYTTVITTITSKAPPGKAIPSSEQIIDKSVRKTEDNVNLADDQYVIGTTIDVDHIKAILRSNQITEQQKPPEKSDGKPPDEPPQSQQISTISVNVNQTSPVHSACTSETRVSTCTRSVTMGINEQTSDGAPVVTPENSESCASAPGVAPQPHPMEQSVDNIKEQSVERTDMNFEERIADYDEPYLESYHEKRRAEEENHEHTSVDVSLSKTSPDRGTDQEATDEEPLYDEPPDCKEVVLPSSERVCVTETVTTTVELEPAPVPEPDAPADDPAPEPEPEASPAPESDSHETSPETDSSEEATVRHVITSTQTTITTNLEERVLNIKKPESIISDKDPHVPEKKEPEPVRMMDEENEAYKLEKLEEERRHLEEEMRALRIAESEQERLDRKKREELLRCQELELRLAASPRTSVEVHHSPAEEKEEDLEEHQISPVGTKTPPASPMPDPEPEPDETDHQASTSGRRTVKTVTITTTETRRYTEQNGHDAPDEIDTTKNRLSDPDPEPTDPEHEAMTSRILLGKNPYGESPKKRKKQLSFDETVTTTTTTKTVTRLNRANSDRRDDGEIPEEQQRDETGHSNEMIIEEQTERVVISGENDAQDENETEPALGAAAPHQCMSCGLNITAACVTAMAPNSGQAQKFHPTCFVCTYCLKPLNQRGTYREHAKKPYCHECFYRLFSGLIYSFDDKMRAL